ncbi:MAG: glycosyltransferase [Deltaproteobacteria bacterium]|nr:glycosyltransferase [Deltaproteobacteria bacterium]
MPRASLVIPTRNRAPALARTLTSFLGQRERDFEVVIVDDGSDDPTPEVVRGFASRLDLRYLRKAQRGIAAARTAAMRAARGDVLVQTDDDRLADPDFVGDHVAAHAAGGPWIIAGAQRAVLAEWSAEAQLPADAVATIVARDPSLAPRLGAPRAELISCAMLEADLAGTLVAHGQDEPWWLAASQPMVARYGADLVGFAFPWALAIGGNTSVPRALAEQVDYLDEAFVGWGLEDTDFHYRLCQAGARVRVLDGGRSYHQLHRRGPELGREWLRNAGRLLRKHASVELCIYIAALRRMTSITAASELALLAAQAAPAIQAELVAAHRELVALVA